MYTNKAKNLTVFRPKKLEILCNISIITDLNILKYIKSAFLIFRKNSIQKINKKFEFDDDMNTKKQN